MSLKDIERGLLGLSEAIPEIVQKGVKSLATEIGNKLIDDATPVKTGRLAHNWQASKDRSAHYDEGAEGTRESAKADLARSIEKVQLNDDDLKMFLNNAAPYAFAKFIADRNNQQRVKRAIRDPDVRKTLRKTIRDELDKALRKR